MIDDMRPNQPVESIEPGWLVRIAGRWQAVAATVETEGGDGARYVWLFFGAPTPAVFQKGATVEARPPMEEEGSNALGDSTTDRYQVVERRLKDVRGDDETLVDYVADGRAMRKSWQLISFELWQDTGIRVNPETLRRWAGRADSGAQDQNQDQDQEG